MLAVGISIEVLSPYLEQYKRSAWIACFNSPNSLTISGMRSSLEALKIDIESAGHFARLLQVDLAYHSELMNPIGQEYELLLDKKLRPLDGFSDVAMFSSVAGSRQTNATDALYWKTNMVSPVRFNEAAMNMLSGHDRPNFLIEIGPSGALAGPVSQIKKTLPSHDTEISYCASWSRGINAGKSIFDVAGRLFIAGGSINMAGVNRYASYDTEKKASTIIDLPNYVWNHSIKYWHENEASKDWRFKKHVHHDLLGSKVLGSSWRAPSWRKLLSLADVPWLRDHKMGPDVLMPGSGFISMAVEALYQMEQAINRDESVSSSNDLCYRLRNIRFDKALVLEEGKEAAIMLSLARQPGNIDWNEFRISSSLDDVIVEHCSGQIRLQEPLDDVLDKNRFTPLKYPTSGQMWYKAQGETGYGFGPDFQRLLEVESVSGQRHCRTLVSLIEPKSKWAPQSSYPIHPASLDGCFQTVTPSLWAGERSSLNAVLVPSIIDDLIINRVGTDLKKGLSIASSEYSGRGRLEEAKSYFSNCSVYDSESGAVLMQMSGLRFAKLDTVAKPDPHTFDRISWKADISFLTQDQLRQSPVTTSATQIDIIVDLIAHKKPALKVLEINLDTTDSSCLWFDGGDPSTRAAYLKYDFSSSDAKSLINAQSEHEAHRDSSFFMMNPTREALGLPQTTYDLAIVKFAKSSQVGMEDFVRNLELLLSEDSFTLFIPHSQAILGMQADDGDQTPETPGTPETPAESSALAPGTPASSISEESVAVSLQDAKVKSVLENENPPVILRFDAAPTEESRSWNLRKLQSLMSTRRLGSILEITDGGATSACLCTPKPKDQEPGYSQNLYVARLAKSTPAMATSLKTILQASGWSITEQTYPFSNLAVGNTIMILDELSNPVLTQINSDQWEALKVLVNSGNRLLWVTKGAQFNVTNPNNALAHGLFRVIRMENANTRLTALDVQSSTSPATGWAINELLKSLSKGKPKIFVETEFAERDGILYTHRIVPDTLINKLKHDEIKGAEPVRKSLHGAEGTVALRAERLGTFQGLTWCETAASQIPVAANKVEVEIMAVGVNFKVSLTPPAPRSFPSHHSMESVKFWAGRCRVNGHCTRKRIYPGIRSRWGC